MIEQIILKNYKSIREATIPLGKLNILIGSNGSGKSNFLSFFHLLMEGANEHLHTEVNLQGGFGELIHYSASPQEVLEWEMVLGDTSPTEEIHYAVQLARRGIASYSIHSENIFSPFDRKILNIYDGQGTLYSDKEEIFRVESEQELAITQIRNRTRYPVITEVRRQIAEWQVFRGFGNDALKNMRSAQVFNVIEPLRLDPSGINLVSVLQQLANESRYESVNERIHAIFQLAFPDFVKFDIPISAGGTGSLSYRSRNLNKSVPAISMSDGQLRFLGLVILLLLPNAPALIAIDEPEIGLHPQMLDILVELLKEAATHTQLIVTTHSTRFLDFVDADDVIALDLVDGQTQFTRINAERLQRWLELYSLGKLWQIGKLGT